MKRTILSTIFTWLMGVFLVLGQEPATTYSYVFGNNVSEQDCAMPQDPSIKYTTFSTNDDLLTINKNAGQEFWFHDVKHGIVVYNNNTFEIKVAGNAIITFNACNYNAANSTLTYLDKDGNTLGTTAGDHNNGGEGDFPINFAYSGPAGTVTAKLTTSGAVYYHSIVVENANAPAPKSKKIDVWDFGAQQLDTAIYNNQLTEDIINDFYPSSIQRGSTGNDFVSSFSAGVLSWKGGTNDRLRTTNLNLTRKDEQNAGGSEYTGRLYVNAAAQTGRYLSLSLNEDDEVTLVTLTQSGTGQINFTYVADPASQTDVVAVGSSPQTVNFVAKKAGIYRIFDAVDKPSYFRIYRKDAVYANFTGTVTAPAALTANYSIVFTNEAGKSWVADVSNDSYSASLPAGKTYDLSLMDANGFVISNGETLEVTESTTSYDIEIEQVELYTVTGSITGLGDQLSKLNLVFAPDPSANKIFIPDPAINIGDGTYSVQLEPNVKYSITSEGVNDYYLENAEMQIGNANENIDLPYAEKAKYKVTINADGLNAEQLGKLQLTFTNLNEEGYVYAFNSVDNIELRDGTYAIDYAGLDDYQFEMTLTSNLIINGAATAKTLTFTSITNWTFDDKDITTSTSAYKGLMFTGGISNERNKGHLVGKAGATIKVPVSPGDKIQVTYYYTADFTIEGGETYTTNSQSTSQLEYADFEYKGFEPGYVTITIGSGVSTTYITNIAIGGKIPYTPIIYVGEDKEYKSINEALDAITTMIRTDERVIVMIDPGNYEEMLVIRSKNITLKNAAENPGIGLKNKGVDIEDNAVRITSYYGTGYHYFSQGTDQKWNAEILRVNKENGYRSTDNTGDGTTSYWNATVVVSASGFEAENIIFENSFNQYISQKESEDVVELWESGNKGVRPTDYGNTDVQQRSFVERAAAIALTSSADKTILSKCRVVGRQDSYFGDRGVRVVMYKGAMMGAVDYIFGGMIAVFYQSDLVMNTSDTNGDAAYLTAAQQGSGRGYLMYECNVKSTVPGVETASANSAKPGYFGRPWEAVTSEVVFYNTNIEASQFPGSVGKSLISPEGWARTLGGESEKMYEFGTIEQSGENNQALRAPWSTVLTQPKLNDGTEITPYNFTKGNDGWDPLPALIAKEGALAVVPPKKDASIQIYAQGNLIFVNHASQAATINVYSLNGTKVKSFQISQNQTNFSIGKGLWIVDVITENGHNTVKVLTH